MTKRAVAHGRAAHAVLTWLHGREVQPITMRAPSNDHTGVADTSPVPRNEAEVREAIRLALAAPAGEMLHLRAPTTHIDLGRPEVERAALLACKLPGEGDAIDQLERELRDVLATLKSPRVWHSVRWLAAALCDHRAVSGATAAAVIRGAMLSGARAAIEPHPRAVRITPGASPRLRPTQATRNPGRDDRSSSSATRPLAI